MYCEVLRTRRNASKEEYAYLLYMCIMLIIYGNDLYSYIYGMIFTTTVYVHFMIIPYAHTLQIIQMKNDIIKSLNSIYFSIWMTKNYGK